MKVEKLRRNFWISAEIECMLNLLREVYNVQGTTATTNYTFILIANKMRKRGFPNKSAAQIRRKWFQMKSAYLCYKRGNTERLLLIPEKFRPTIAEFVDKEVKTHTYSELPASPTSPPAPPPPVVSAPAPPPAPAPVPVQTPPATITSNANYKMRDTSNVAKPSQGFGKNLYRDSRFDDFLSRVKQTHKIINNDFSNMQKILMDFEHECQSERDAKLIQFIKNTKYNF
ncbi:uncharacterized protein LOC128863996 [Anastrepha ludens]|uniref:uncharacterized protein LOC128863996 n=1 Tax=Anastrepha ludens TaxID=28586 RepID=UPI0023B05EEF|nr:uncharacterized protein LOC128863996 [Anastrepha ludens]